MTKSMLYEMLVHHEAKMKVEIDSIQNRLRRLELNKLQEMGYQIDEEHQVIMIPDGDPLFHITNLKANWPLCLKSFEDSPQWTPYHYTKGGWNWKVIQNGTEIRELDL